MKQNLLFTAILMLSALLLNAQSSAERVYTIFQTHCSTAGCHNNAAQAAGLDLEGDGANLNSKMADVYNNIYKQTPSNAEAAAKDNYLIYPGDPYRSFLYRKIDDGLSSDVHLSVNEGDAMPLNGSTMTDIEKEAIRQWILYGAHSSGDLYDHSMVEEYYTNGGIESVENVPAPPAAGEGFQIHLGPFFIGPDEEVEFLNKYETNFDVTNEITKFETTMGEFSHHFIVYSFIEYSSGDPIPVNQVPAPYGLRDNIGFDNKGFVITEQYSNTLELPEGTAFEWQEDLVLDLNSHYINYSSTEVLKCDVYLNVYTQDEGVANQIMYSQLVPNTNIPIPNDGQEHDFNFYFPYTAGQFVNPLFQDPLIHLWGVVAHTHQYGTDFDISINGETIYDAGCANGVPGCAVEEFDYQHLPFRFYEPFYPFGTGDYLNAYATYVNDGPSPVNWGLTSDDEMMLFVIFFTLDTAGIDFGNPPSSISGLNENLNVAFYPNPSNGSSALYILNKAKESLTIEFIDMNGKVVSSTRSSRNELSMVPVNTSEWSKGLYFYRILDNGNALHTGKFSVE